MGMYNQKSSGRGAVRLACLHGVQEVPGSNPGAPTEIAWLYGVIYKIPKKKVAFAIV